MRYRADIDGLRAVAVAVVILFHLEFSWLPGGFVGVDVFFVISGFLITSLITRQISENRFSLIDFYERRFRRIYPNLLVVLTVTAVLGFLVMVPLTYRPFGRTLIWATLSASNFAFIGGNGYFDPDNLTKPLLHTWSLGVEEQFYLVFPWLLILAAKRGYGMKWPIAVVVGLSLALSIAAAMANWSPSYFLLPTRLWELGIGALIAVLPLSDRLTSLQRSALGLGGLAAIVWAALRLSESDPFPGYLALAPTLGAAATIWANGGPSGRLLSLPPFVWIGRLSFALYLWHWPLISLAAGIGLAPTEPYVRLVITGLMLALSVVGYYLWEQPIRHRRLLAGRRRFFIALTVFVVPVVGIGIAIFEMRGVPQRLPADLVAMDAATRRESFYIVKRCPASAKTEPASCPLGDDAARQVSFVVIGDSHAQAVAAEIGDLAKAYRLRGLYLGKAGCPPLADLTRSPNSHCPRQYEFALDSIRKHKPSLVIYVSQWSAVVGDPNGGYKTPLFLNDQPISEPKRLEIAASALDKTLDDIGIRQVVTALTVPEYNSKAPVVWRRWTERFGLPSSLTDLMTSEYLLRQTYVQELLSNAKAKHSNLIVLDPAPIFCATNVCIRTAGDAILYRDNTHLSHAGALLYAPLFEPLFATLAKAEAIPR